MGKAGDYPFRDVEGRGGFLAARELHMCLLLATSEFARFSSRVNKTIVGPRPIDEEIIE